MKKKNHRGEERRGEEEEEEEEEKKKRSQDKKGMETNLEYGFYDFWYGIVWITWISCIDTCLWVVGCRKPNPIMNSCMEIITNLFVFLGFCYERT